MTTASAAAAGAEVAQLAELMETLRVQCPWDRVQTHGSLRRHLLEEAHEALEALDHLDATERGRADAATIDDAARHLEEELGDLLFQVVFHAHLAAEAGRFDLGDVARTVHDKLVARHPQLFADRDVVDDPAHRSADAADLAAGWEQAKLAEKGRDSIMDGIPSTLGALAFAGKVVGKSQVAAPDLIAASSDAFDDEQELGRHLLGLVAAARMRGLDAESALRRAANELVDEVRRREAHD